MTAELRTMHIGGLRDLDEPPGYWQDGPDLSEDEALAAAEARIRQQEAAYDDLREERGE